MHQAPQIAALAPLPVVVGRWRPMAPGGRSPIVSSLSLASRVAAGGGSRIRALADRARLGEPPPKLGDALRDAHVSGWEGIPCAFALSTGRVGSATLTALWALAPDVVSSHEPLPRLIEVSKRAWERPSDPIWTSVVYGARDDLVADAWRRGLLWAETNNRLTTLAPALAAAFPAARFVHLWREPGAFIASGMARKWFRGHHWDFARFAPHHPDPLADIWDTLEPIDQIAWLWAAVNRFIIEFHAMHPERVVRVDADDMFSADPAALEALFGCVGAPAPPESRYLRVLGKRMNAGAPVPIPADWFSALAEPIRDLVRDVATELGASVSDV